MTITGSMSAVDRGHRLSPPSLANPVRVFLSHGVTFNYSTVSSAHDSLSFRLSQRPRAHRMLHQEDAFACDTASALTTASCC